MNMNSIKTSNPVSSSYTRELRIRWAQQMNDHYIIYMTTRPSIFHVPKSMSDTNPEAYVPQQIGLGPYHHFLPDLGRKADAALEFLKKEKFEKFKSLIVDKVIGMEALVRSPYDEYLDLDCDTLGWIMAIDSVYLLHLLSKYPGKISNDQIEAKGVVMLENQLPDQIEANDTVLAKGVVMLENQLPDQIEANDRVLAKGVVILENQLPDKIEDNDRELAKDVLMLENQLPFQLLKEIRKAVKATIYEDGVEDTKKHKDKDEDEEEEAGNEEENIEIEERGEEEDDDENKEEGEEEEEDEKTKEDKSDKELFKEMFAFCKAHSPLDLSEDSEWVYDAECLHLLCYMYWLIRYNWQTIVKADEGESNFRIFGALPKKRKKNKKFRKLGDDDDIVDDLKNTAGILGGLTNQKGLLFLANLPLKQLFALFKKDNNPSSIEEINIPSVSQLHYVSRVELGICLSHYPDGIGIKYLEEGGQRMLLLPGIKLNKDSEVILRNLVAYEVRRLASLNLDKSNAVVAGYVDFMCGLIDTVKDVELLKDKRIIESKLPNQDIVKIFNGISKSDLMRKDLEDATKELNSVYDSSFRIKAWKFITDHFVPSEAFAILIVFLLSLQAFCQVYGCSTHWFRKMLSSTATNFIVHFDA